MVHIAYYLVYLVVNCRSTEAKPQFILSSYLLKIYVYKNGRFIKNLPLITESD